MSLVELVATQAMVSQAVHRASIEDPERGTQDKIKRNIHTNHGEGTEQIDELKCSMGG